MNSGAFLGFEVRSVVATEKDVLQAMGRYYAVGSESVESIINQMETDAELAAAAVAVQQNMVDLTSVEALADTPRSASS